MKKFLFLLLFPMPLTAQVYLWDENSVHEYNQARDRLMNDTMLDATDIVKSGMYSGYIAGTLDLGSGILFCPPRNVTLNQAMDVAAKHLKNSPEARDKQASHLVVDSFINAWPCQKK
ncbi:Rap1a/Tai family immunity protein [Proteus vulgaris]|uniref:Rap1a/Tai family immunity protein n=2 Tax=Proteus TaxID=583 RepID=UPI00235F55D0|nr:Rap1a/Tai family immunity protein [Proteus vulgaris]